MKLEYVLVVAAAAWLPVFVLGYRDGAHARPVRSIACAIVLVALGTCGFFIPSLAVRVWTGINLAVVVFCAMGIVDNVTHHNPRSGQGAVILVPLALLATLSLLACAIYAVIAT